jgi:pSer/pThr/pTyr-binding forkhead associated (FHA) protein
VARPAPSSPRPPVPPRPAAPPPASAVAPVAKPPSPHPPAASAEGTVVFAGLHAVQVEAKIFEKKPDGSAGRAVAITKETLIGRENCDLCYPQDQLLSDRHASLVIREGKLLLRDLGSQNGSFVRQRQDSELSPGDVFLLGRELFRFTTQSLDEAEGKSAMQGTVMWSGPPKLQKGPVTAKLEHIKLNGEIVAEFKLEKPETTLGRTTGDLLFADDHYMSGTHARIVAQPGRFVLQDLRSRNGVYRRVRDEMQLADGDEFFMGEQLFRVEVKTID